MVDVSSRAFAEAYNEAPFWSARFGALLFSQLELKRAMRVMDLGCGTGFPLFELANVLGDTSRVTGVDVWDHALSIAESKRKLFGFDHVDLVKVSPGENLPFSSGAFDLIVSNLGLNNFTDPKATALECARVLKPNGRLVLTTNLRGHMAEFYEEYRGALTDLGLDHLLPKLQQQEDHRATLASITALLEGAGLSLVKHVADSFQWRFLDGTTFLKHSFIRLGFVASWRAVAAGEDVTDIFTTIERRLNERAEREGCLSLTIPTLYVEAAKEIVGVSAKSLGY